MYLKNNCIDIQDGSSRWKLYSPPPRTKLELQLNYRTLTLNNELRLAEEKSYNQGFREGAISTGRKGGEVKSTGPISMGSH